MGEISVKTGNNARNGGKNSLNRLIRCVCGKKSAQIREILISESAWEEMTCLFAPSLAAIARKDYQDRRRRQAEGIKKAKEEGKYRGRQADSDLHEKIYQLRVINKLSISDTAKLTNVSDRTVIRVAKKLAGERSAG